MQVSHTEGQKVPDPYWKYGTGTNEGRNLGSKSEQLFLREIREIDLKLLWDIVGGIPTQEVPGEGNDHSRRLGASEARDLSCWSTGPKVRVLCLVKAATGPTARMELSRMVRS